MMSRNVRKSAKHMFAALLCCLIMGSALLCFADEKGTVTVESAKVREQADASSNQVGSVPKGGTVDIAGETTGTDGKKWYQVSVNGNLKGYIRSDLISKGGTQAPAVNAGADAAVTPIEPKQGTVTNNSVYVRKNSSTESTDIATVSRGIVLTVTGEATGTDGKKWYQVTFKHNEKEIGGFIRADLVTFDNVPADPAVSEITGTGEGNGEVQPETAQQNETKEQEPPKKEDNSSADENAGIIFMNAEEEPYIMPGFEPVTLDWNGQKISAYRNGTFFIVYAQKQNGDEGWYMLDKEKNVYQRYPYAVENATVPKDGILSGNLVPIIIMAAVIAVMLIIIIVLALKLNGGGYYEEYDDEDDYPDEDDEDEEIEELEEEVLRMPPPRRALQQAGTAQGQRQPSQQPGTNPARHAPQQAGTAQGQGQPVRRPSQQAGTAQGQSQPPQQPGTNPARRAPQQAGTAQGQGQPVRRPSQLQGQPEHPKRPSPQSGRPVPNAQPQKGQKSKGFLDKEEDDDMDFVDI